MGLGTASWQCFLSPFPVWFSSDVVQTSSHQEASIQVMYNDTTGKRVHVGIRTLVLNGAFCGVWRTHVLIPTLQDLDTGGFRPSPVRFTNCVDDEEMHPTGDRSHHNPLPPRSSRLLLLGPSMSERGSGNNKVVKGWRNVCFSVPTQGAVFPLPGSSETFCKDTEREMSETSSDTKRAVAGRVFNLCPVLPSRQ